MAEGREGLPGLVGGEAHAGDHLLPVLAQRLVPELEDILDLASAHVAVGVVLLVLARVAPEESARLELPVGVEVPVALGVRHLREMDLDEVFVALFFLDLVPLHDVVEAVGVEAGVGASAPAPDGVLGPDVLLALAPPEHELGPFVAVAVFVVGEVFNVSIEDADHVDGVPAVGDHQGCQGLVAESD